MGAFAINLVFNGFSSIYSAGIQASNIMVKHRFHIVCKYTNNFLPESFHLEK